MLTKTVFFQEIKDEALKRIRKYKSFFLMMTAVM